MIPQGTWSNPLIRVHWYEYIHLERTILGLIEVRQNYPWGTKDAIPAPLDRSTDDQFWAGQWFSAHPLGNSPTPDGSILSEYLVQDPNRLGRTSVMTFRRRLPFLVRILSTASPLGFQTHPTQQQARDGHARESLMGIPLGAPECSLKDDWPKSETIVALTPSEALVGFRDPPLTAQLFETLEVGDAPASVIGSLRDRTSSPIPQEVFLDVLSLGDHRHLVSEVLGVAVNHLDAPGGLGVFAHTATGIDKYFPSNPGILTALLLNRFSLEPGQALALPPGVIHSYLRGTCIEVMANSSNVLRGGPTGKHIDVDTLLHVVGFTSGPGDVLLSSRSGGTYIYPTGFEELELWLLQPTDRSTLQVPRGDSGRIYPVASGSFELTGNDDPVVPRLRHAIFVAAEEAAVTRSEGQLFVAATGI